MDQSNRYAALDLKEEDLIRAGGHILVAYRMKPRAGTSYLSAAAHFAAESSTGTNVEVSTTDDFTKGLDALVYYIDEAAEDLRIAYPIDLFDRNIIDGRFMLVSFLTLVIGNNQGMSDIEHAKMIDFYVPPRVIQMFDGPAKGIADLWRILGRPTQNGSSNRNWDCARSRLPRPPTSSGSAAISSRTMNLRAISFSPRSKKRCPSSTKPCNAPRMKPEKPSCSP